MNATIVFNLATEATASYSTTVVPGFSEDFGHMQALAPDAFFFISRGGGIALFIHRPDGGISAGEFCTDRRCAILEKSRLLQCGRGFVDGR